MSINNHMLSLKNETDIIREARDSIRAHRMALSWRQDDLAKRSGVGIATLRRFESTGRIGFLGLAKLLATLGLADRFLDALKQPAPVPKDINEFLAAAPAPVRQRAPRRAAGN
jgi:transcriptional regulator with XRE-family HTH domain